MGDIKKIFNYDNRIIFKDDLLGFEELILKNQNKYYNIYFDFSNIEDSLKKVKNIIIKNKDNISFDYLYFYNAGDFINIVLDKPIYLPKNINLFISETCPIGCVYCENPNDIHTYLKLSDIKNFLSKYSIGDNINFNILGQGDPIFNPELLEILSYIKGLGGYITFFSGGKSLLFVKKIDSFINMVDEFKINLSASNSEIYNKIHKNKISDSDFKSLVDRFREISYKSTFLTIILKDNILDLSNFIKFAIGIGAYSIEIKKNMHYPEKDILNNKSIFDKVFKLLDRFSKVKKINIVSNIGFGLTNYVNLKPYYNRSVTLLDEILEDFKLNNNLFSKDINNLGVCYQFGNSIDITESKNIALCCHYDISNLSDLNYDGYYYDNQEFVLKKEQYTKSTPKSCLKCPMPIDRYNNYLKYNFVKDL